MSFFSKPDRRGLLLLEWLAILALVLLWAYSNRESQESDHGNAATADSLSRNARHNRNFTSKTYTYAVPETPVESFPFDPNTADSTTLLRLGLAPWQVQTIYKYRAKHGRYHRPEDFKRLPGMTAELWDRLGKYVTIAPKYRYLELSPEKKSFPSRGKTKAQELPRHKTPEIVVTTDSLNTADSTTASKDSSHYPVKFDKPTLVDINTADTNLLKKIPNIGSFRARMIVEYRERLGGYTKVEQVMESCEMPDEVMEWFSLVPVPVKMLDVNRLSVRQLMRHPYLSFYQARAIVEYRKTNKSIKQIEELLALEKFSYADIERLRPYLLFQ